MPDAKPTPKPESDVKALKPTRAFTPFAVVFTAIEVAMYIELGRLASGWLTIVAWFLAGLDLVVFLAGPALRRKTWRRYMVGARAVDRITAMRGQQLRADDVFDAAPMTDRASFFVGVAFAMRQVETQIERAGNDVDAL